MKKKTEIQFSNNERRALGLGFGKLKGSIKEQQALRNILDVFPWVVKVADCNFDKIVGVTHVVAAAQVMSADIAYEQYQKSREEQK